MRFFIILFLLIFTVSCSSNVTTIQEEQKPIEHKYYSIGEKVEGMTTYIINKVTIIGDGQEGKKWICLDVTVFNVDNQSEDFISTPVLVGKDNYYYEGYKEDPKIPSMGNIRTNVLFEVPKSEMQFKFYFDIGFEQSGINDYSKDIVRIVL